MRVGEEDIFAVEKLLRNFRGTLRQHVQVHFDGDGFVQILQIGAMPAEGLASFARLQSAGVDVAPLKDVEEAPGAILPYYADQSHRCKKRSGIGKVNRR